MEVIFWQLLREVRSKPVDADGKKRLSAEYLQEELDSAVTYQRISLRETPCDDIEIALLKRLVRSANAYGGVEEEDILSVRDKYRRRNR
jgi:hypothetical protein